MKRYLYILSALLAAACGKTPEQGQEEAKASISVSPSEGSFSSGGTETLSLTVTASGDWTATKSASWITAVTPSSGTGDATVTVSAGYNAGEAREGTVTFQDRNRTVSAVVTVRQEGYTPPEESNVTPAPAPFDGNKRASTTYQLLIYSFADSDGDGVGDFRGIRERLDYLDALGVTALWLSPAHPADSYHGYDVTDYTTVNPLYGTEQDFKDLIDAAHAKGIQIYMDYVLNHSGKGHPWFREALSNPSSPFRNYYFISSNPAADYSSFPMLKGTDYVAGEWKQATSGSPRIRILETTEPVTSGDSNWNLWLWKAGADGQAIRFKDQGDGTLYVVVDISGPYGLLVRRDMNWDTGSKFGASGNGTLSEGTAMDLVGDGGDLSFTGSGRYRIELSNLSMQNLYYMGAFSDWMPDLNYGDVSKAETNACFQALAASADKWIGLGVDGFRLDAVKHICGGIGSYNSSSDITLLQKWYAHCNATYQGDGPIFMVAEAWEGHQAEKQYYKGINSCFEFDYFYNGDDRCLLVSTLKGNAGGYVSAVNGFIADHRSVRPDAITSLFLSNHDQDRAAERLGRNPALMKQAAAMLLTTPGKPFIYQGEELGYWGTKAGGDEYVRTPILWDKAGKQCAKKGVNNQVDGDMLTPSISVEAQAADDASLLTVYRTWSRLRNTYPALADGTMTEAPGNGGTLAAWYMTGAEGPRLLVLHNTGVSVKTLTLTGDTSCPVALLGSATLTGNTLKLGPHSSLVFRQ